MCWPMNNLVMYWNRMTIVTPAFFEDCSITGIILAIVLLAAKLAPSRTLQRKTWSSVKPWRTYELFFSLLFSCLQDAKDARQGNCHVSQPQGHRHSNSGAAFIGVYRNTRTGFLKLREKYVWQYAPSKQIEGKRRNRVVAKEKSSLVGSRVLAVFRINPQWSCRRRYLRVKLWFFVLVRSRIKVFSIALNFE